MGWLVANETLPWNLDGRARLVTHVMPVAAFSGERQINFVKATQQPIVFAPSPRATGWNYWFNVDGVVAYDGSGRGNEQISFGYTQLFRSGCIESVISLFCNEPLTIGLDAVENYIFEGLKQNIRTLTQLDVSWPIVVAVSLTGVKGAVPYIEFGGFRERPVPIVRNELLLPDVLIDENCRDANEYLKPIFNTLANAFGFPRSSRYDEHGNVFVRA